jgi:hypothetical protein
MRKYLLTWDRKPGLYGLQDPKWDDDYVIFLPTAGDCEVSKKERDRFVRFPNGSQIFDSMEKAQESKKAMESIAITARIIKGSKTKIVFEGCYDGDPVTIRTYGKYVKAPIFDVTISEIEIPE